MTNNNLREVSINNHIIIIILYYNSNNIISIGDINLKNIKRFFDKNHKKILFFMTSLNMKQDIV